MRRPVVGVMGGGEADEARTAAAYELGRLVAENGWILLNGGRDAGVMDASAKGAHDAGGLTVGVLPGDDREHASPYLDVQIVTGMGSARNNVNVLSSDVVVACSGGAGTLSEVALALKAGRPVVVLGFDIGTSFDVYVGSGQLVQVDSPGEAIRALGERLAARA
jgi:uncharacterized protein (TIGR00725 family)